MAKNPKTPKTETKPADSDTTPATTATPKKRGRTHLTQADKDHMQACRKIAAEAKDQVTKALSDDGITNPDVWAGLPPMQFERIVGTVKAVRALKRNAALAEAKAQLIEACKGDGSEPDAALLKAVPNVDEPKRCKYSEAEKATLAKAQAEATNDLTKALCDVRASDHRVWMDIPQAKLDAIANVTAGQMAVMSAKRVSEAKAALAALLADAGQSNG